MRKRFNTVLAGLVALLTGGVMAAAPAGAVTGGTYDSANQYSNVGMIVFYEDGGRYRCSATLGSSTVLPTAAHCTFGTAGRTIVTFDKHIADAPPSGLPTAANPSAGYTTADIAGRPDYYAGTAQSHPD